LVTLGVVAVLLALLTTLQYTADVLGAFLPINAAAAWVLLCARKERLQALNPKS
jgi:hypothetical protein